MTDVTALRARIEAAFDRIGGGLEGLAAGGAAEQEVARLTRALEAEQSASAELEARVESLRARQDGTVEALTAENERLRGQLAEVEQTLSRLARVNAALRTNNAGLREALAEGVAEPHLVNKSMMAELEALRSAQAADRAELDAVLGEINALMAEAEAGTGAGAEAKAGEKSGEAAHA